MAYQQIWPFNGYPGSDDDSLYDALAELAGPLYRPSAGSVYIRPHGLGVPLARGDFVR